MLIIKSMVKLASSHNLKCNSVFKNGPSKNCGRQLLKKLNGMACPFKFFKECLPQILLGLLLNTWILNCHLQGKNIFSLKAHACPELNKTIFGKSLMLLFLGSMNRKLTCFQGIGKNENIIFFPAWINRNHLSVCLV